MPSSNPPLSLVSLLASLSYALDLTEGQPMGHAIRTCLIGLRLAQTLGLSDEERDALHLALLLKDAGCSSNSARMYALFGGNELVAKQDSKIRDWRRMSEAVKFALRHAAPQEGLVLRLAQLRQLSQQPERVMDVLTEARCTRGAEIAQLLGLVPAVSETIRALDEHWDGEGAPYHRHSEDIPLLARIACLSQTLEVFVTTFGVARAYKVIRQRSGTWFDPTVVEAALAFRTESGFWYGLQHKAEELLAAQTSERLRTQVTEAGLDSVCAAFAQIVDAKSSFTAEHSNRVAHYTEVLAVQLDLDETRRVMLQRAALLHDLGKLAIPNLILDKPGRLNETEFSLVKKHPHYTQQILSHIPGFGRICAIAAAHHEKLDGSGYFQGLTSAQLDLEMRLLTVADIYDALTAARPYRAALSHKDARAVLLKESGRALDAHVVAATEVLIPV